MWNEHTCGMIQNPMPKPVNLQVHQSIKSNLVTNTLLHTVTCGYSLYLLHTTCLSSHARKRIPPSMPCWTLANA